MRRAVYASLVLLFTTACAPDSVTVVRPVQFDAAYQPSFQSNLARYGAVPTVIRGNPFAVDQAALDEAVTTALAGNYFGPDLTFESVPRNTVAPYRLLIYFNPAPFVRPDKACFRGDQPLQPGGDGVAVLMVICSSEYRVSSTIGYRGDVFRPDGPEFRDLMRTTLTTILPPQRFDINGGNSPRRG
ncbi:MAG: hypothetical protein QNJ67_10275 [Kiloniellales bacterium]|nr:hypothetical protein [Kiloniellales bacterium]